MMMMMLMMVVMLVMMVAMDSYCSAWFNRAWSRIRRMAIATFAFGCLTILYANERPFRLQW
jgi:hypothetical protein